MDTFNLASVFTPGILLNPEHAMNPAQYKTSQKVVQFLVEHQHCFKMPRSSPFNQQQQSSQQQQQQQQQQKDQNVTQEKDQKPTSISSSPPQAGAPAHRHNSQPHHSTTTNTTHNNTTTSTSTFNNYNTHKQPTDLNTDSIFPTTFPARPTSVDLSVHKQQKVKRAKTMPTRRSKYGPNDPLQVVQLNKSVAETTMIN